MWTAFLIGLLSEFFGESKQIARFVLKGFASGLAGLILNFALVTLISKQASVLIGYEAPTLNNVNTEFVLVPFVAAFVALIIVKAARLFSNLGSETERTYVS
jgi:hypothetical protein